MYSHVYLKSIAAIDLSRCPFKQGGLNPTTFLMQY